MVKLKCYKCGERHWSTEKCKGGKPLVTESFESQVLKGIPVFFDLSVKGSLVKDSVTDQSGVHSGNSLISAKESLQPVLKTPPGRKKRYETNAARQRAYRNRKKTIKD